MEIKQKNRKSIFLKIALLVMCVIIFIIIIIVGLGSLILHHKSPLKPEKSFLQYVDRIPGEIGIPPEPGRIKQVAEDYGLIILYKGPDFEYESEKSYSLSTKLMNNLNNNDMGIKGRYLYIYRKIGIHQFLIASSLFFRGGIVNFFLFISISFLITLILVVHQIIRKILFPIKFLITAVDKVKSGDFSFKVPVKSQDELGRLSESFNAMTDMIKKMIIAKEKLLLDVSHELRSPLTRIKVNLEFIENQKTKRSLQTDVIEMEKMIMEILETEKIDHDAGSIIFEEMSISQILSEVITLFKDDRKRITLLPHNCKVVIKMNRVRMKMLFRNIIENALHYSGNNPVSVEIQCEPHNVVISVIDQGQGIPEQDLPFIFEPFYRADVSRSRKTGGYGLGMYLCKKITDLHHGEIKVQSILGQGTTVIVSFPCEN